MKKCKYVFINKNIWNDERFRRMSAKGKLVFFELIFSVFSYKLKMKIDIHGFDFLLKDFYECVKAGLISYDEREKTVELLCVNDLIKFSKK